MKWIIENWYVVLGLLTILVAFGFAVYRFAGLPTKAQIAKVKEWLLYAVIKAEKQLGGGTGEIKLRLVYDWFLAIKTFNIIAVFLTFDRFKFLVDEALERMQELLETNDGVHSYVLDGEDDIK